MESLLGNLAMPEDLVNHPKHYTQGNIECIEFIEDQGLGKEFCLGNAIKYIVRSRHKGNEEQDLEKAIWYIKRRLNQIRNGKV